VGQKYKIKLHINVAHGTLTLKVLLFLFLKNNFYYLKVVCLRVIIF